jgi:ribosomal protein L32
MNNPCTDCKDYTKGKTALPCPNVRECPAKQEYNKQIRINTHNPCNTCKKSGTEHKFCRKYGMFMKWLEKTYNGIQEIDETKLRYCDMDHTPTREFKQHYREIIKCSKCSREINPGEYYYTCGEWDEKYYCESCKNQE